MLQAAEASALLGGPCEELCALARAHSRASAPALATLAAALRSDAARGGAGAAARDAALREAEAALVALVADLAAAAAAQQACLARLRARVEYVSAEGGPGWWAARADRLLCEHLHRAGRTAAAAALEASVPGLSLLQDGAVHARRDGLRAALAGGDAAPALAWLASSATPQQLLRLRAHSPALELRLVLQQLAACVVAGDRAGAVALARSRCAPLAAAAPAACAPPLRAAMGLLARPPEAAAALLTPAAWSALAAEFGRAWAAAHGHPPAASHFALALQAGLCVLHTAHAAPRHRGPLGEPELGSLAAALPTARHSRTRLLCRLTGAVLDESNPPLALPNGRVYSRRAVEERAVKGRPGATAEGGECLLVWCPLTGDGPFPLSACRKVFLA